MGGAGVWSQGGTCSQGLPGPGGDVWSGGLVPGGYLLPGGEPGLGGAWSGGVPGGDPPRDGHCCGRNAFLLTHALSFYIRQLG